MNLHEKFLHENLPSLNFGGYLTQERWDPSRVPPHVALHYVFKTPNEMIKIPTTATIHHSNLKGASST